MLVTLAGPALHRREEGGEDAERFGGGAADRRGEAHPEGRDEDGRRPPQDEVLTAVAGLSARLESLEGPQGERVVAAAAQALGVLSQ